MKTRLLFAVLFALAAYGLARADIIVVKGREKALVGAVSAEDAKGITVKPAKLKVADELIPAADIVDIYYEDVRPVELILGGAYKSARDAEKESNESLDAAKRRTALTRAIAQYSDTLTKMNPHKYAKRMIEYKVATLTLRQALSEQLSTDKAVAKLQAFKTAHPTSWQMVHVMPLIAQTQMDAKDYKGAAATFQEMSELSALPADVRISAELEVVRVAVQSGDINMAQKRLDALK